MIFGVIVWKTVAPGGGGYSDIYIHTYVGSGHFLGFKILNFNFYWEFSEK